MFSPFCAKFLDAVSISASTFRFIVSFNIVSGNLGVQSRWKIWETKMVRHSNYLSVHVLLYTYSSGGDPHFPTQSLLHASRNLVHQTEFTGSLPCYKICNFPLTCPLEATHMKTMCTEPSWSCQRYGCPWVILLQSRKQGIGLHNIKSVR